MRYTGMSSRLAFRWNDTKLPRSAAAARNGALAQPCRVCQAWNNADSADATCCTCCAEDFTTMTNFMSTAVNSIASSHPDAKVFSFPSLCAAPI